MESSTPTPSVAPNPANISVPTTTPEIESSADRKRVDALVKAVDTAYHHPWKLFGRSFLQGIGNAFGVIAGYAIFVAVAAFLIQALGGFTLFNPFVEQLQKSLVQSQLRALQGQVAAPSMGTNAAGGSASTQQGEVETGGAATLSPEQLQLLLQTFQSNSTK